MTLDVDIITLIDNILNEEEVINELRPKRVRHVKSGDMRKKRREAKRYRRTHRSAIKRAQRKRKRLTKKSSFKLKQERMAKRGKTATGKRIRRFVNHL